MLTKIMTWVSIGVLLIAVLIYPAASYPLLVGIVICLSAVLVVRQAVRLRKYFWAGGFVAIAVLFNPVMPVALSGKTFLWLDAASLMTFLISLAALKGRPSLPIPSVANRKPASEPL